jgi:hypothetical protein
MLLRAELFAFKVPLLDTRLDGPADCSRFKTL